MMPIAPIVAGVAASVVGSLGAVVPGARLAVDLCSWVYARVKEVEANKQDCEELQRRMKRSKLNVIGHLQTLEDCEEVLPRIMEAKKLDKKQRARLEVLQQATENLPGDLSKLLLCLIQAGQVVETSMTTKGLKSKLKAICKAKTVEQWLRGQWRLD